MQSFVPCHSSRHGRAPSNSLGARLQRVKHLTSLIGAWNGALQKRKKYCAPVLGIGQACELAKVQVATRSDSVPLRLAAESPA